MFTGGGDPMVADHWFRQIENVLEAMDITFDATKIRLATFQLECKTRENSNFLKKGKMIISVKIQNFSRSQMTKRTSPLESSHEI